MFLTRLYYARPSRVKLNLNKYLMIEVLLEATGWRWYFISAAGRILLIGADIFPCNISAARHAKAYKRAFLYYADSIDHRQARCI